MESRAISIVFWPGMTNDIRVVKEHCSACNRSSSSQAATRTIPSPVPSTPFESIFADFLTLLAVTILWLETDYTFGVPEEMSSDCVPEFSLAAIADILTRWEVRHRISSAYSRQSNGRAEVAVKKAKHTLMDNVGPTGSLNNDGLLRALLQAHNTPDPDCNISPAQVVFGRPILDFFPSSADASSTTTHRYPHGATNGPKRRSLCEPGCRALQKS